MPFVVNGHSRCEATHGSVLAAPAICPRQVTSSVLTMRTARHPTTSRRARIAEFNEG